jgi:ubiquinone/menaquinone biosynthesis C-methylase UbiE
MTTKPLQRAEDIHRIAFGFMASKALFSALEFDIFSVLSEEKRTLSEIAERTGMTKNRAEILLTALVSLGLVEKIDGKFLNSSASDHYLVPGRKSFFGDYLRLQIGRQMYPSMLRLDKVLSSAEDSSHLCDYADWMCDPEEAELFSRSQHIGSLGPAAVLGRRVDLTGYKHLLDVGGGTGAFGIMLCRRFPQLHVTVMDFPNVTKVGSELVAQAGLTDRIDFLDGDALVDPWPNSQDAVLMSYFLSSIPGGQIAKIFNLSRKVLTEEGLLLIHDLMEDNDLTGPTLTALWRLQHLIFAPETMSLSTERVHERLRKAGFSVIDEDALIPGMTRFIAARKQVEAG